MLTLKRKKLAYTMLLAILGIGYFSAISSLEINSFLRGYVSIVPVQIGAIIYFFYLRRSSR